MTKDHQRIAVVLFNLGGPSALGEVKSFLFSLFYDPAIITLPNPLRWLLAKIISGRREKQSQELYSLIGGKSPILEETQKQQQALEKLLQTESDEFRVFICMRHSKPDSSDLASQLKAYNANQIILLPLYPQFSTTTTGSAIKDFTSNFKDKPKVKTICCYPDHELFIEAHAQMIMKSIEQLEHRNYRLIFSAHGLPVKVVKSGDPYQFQVEKTVSSIVNKLRLQISPIDHILAYQSRVGPLEWLGPNTEDEIKKAGKENKSVILIPVAFVSEHVETLVELDIEYRKIATDYKIDYVRVGALGIQDLFIKALKDMILTSVASATDFTSGASYKKCPETYCRCSNLKE